MNEMGCSLRSQLKSLHIHCIQDKNIFFQIHMTLIREGFKKQNGNLDMDLFIKLRTPPMDIISTHFLPHFFSLAIDSYHSSY